MYMLIYINVLLIYSYISHQPNSLKRPQEAVNQSSKIPELSSKPVLNSGSSGGVSDGYYYTQFAKFMHY